MWKNFVQSVSGSSASDAGDDSNVVSTGTNGDGVDAAMKGPSISFSESSSTNSTMQQSDESSCLAGEGVEEHKEGTSTYHVRIAKPLSLPVPITPISASPADYVWEHYAESAIRPALTVCPKARSSSGSDLDELAEYQKRFALVDRISRAQAMHIRGESSRSVGSCSIPSETV